MGIDNVLPDGHVLSDAEMAALRKEAEDWTKRMLEMACIPAAAHARTAITHAITKIVQLYVKYGILDGGHLRLNQKGIDMRDAILEELIDKLLDEVEDYACSAPESDDDAILALLSAPFFGMTTRERLKSRVERLKKHLLVEIEMDAKDNGGVIGTGVLPEAIIGIAGITDLVRNEIVRMWQEDRRSRQYDARYVHVFRGSSYPCELCDDEVAKGWQPIDTAVLPPFHNHCVCFTVYL